MLTLLMTLPIKPGKTASARSFAQDCLGSRFAEFDASERRIGIPIENWYLQRIGGAEFFTALLEGPDLNASLAAFIASQDPFDLWFKARFSEITGVNLNAGPPAAEAVAETLVEYRVS